MFRLKKTDAICAVMLLIRQRLKIPLYRQRLWVIQPRENRTHRVDHVSSEEERLSLPWLLLTMVIDKLFGLLLLLLLLRLTPPPLPQGVN